MQVQGQGAMTPEVHVSALDRMLDFQEKMLTVSDESTIEKTIGVMLDFFATLSQTQNNEESKLSRKLEQYAKESNKKNVKAHNMQAIFSFASLGVAGAMVGAGQLKGPIGGVVGAFTQRINRPGLNFANTDLFKNLNISGDAALQGGKTADAVNSEVHGGAKTESGFETNSYQSQTQRSSESQGRLAQIRKELESQRARLDSERKDLFMRMTQG